MPLLTVSDVAEELNCSQRHVRDLLATGRLVPVRIGNRSLRFEPSEIARFLEAGRAFRTAPAPTKPKPFPVANFEIDPGQAWGGKKGRKSA